MYRTRPYWEFQSSDLTRVSGNIDACKTYGVWRLPIGLLSATVVPLPTAVPRPPAEYSSTIIRSLADATMDEVSCRK